MQEYKIGDRVRVTYCGEDLGMGKVTRLPDPTEYDDDFRVMLDIKPDMWIQEMFLGPENMMRPEPQVGDRVRVEYWGEDMGIGTVTQNDNDFRVLMDVKNPLYIQEMYLLPSEVAVVANDGVTVVAPKATKRNLADALKLEPLPRKILAHLERRKSISPMEALTTYGTSRLAAAIHKLRKAGWDIVSDLHEDEVGHRYARYSLAA